jgi:nicotinate-nucleotide pyrophosphorylase (carboxylating)
MNDCRPPLPLLYEPTVEAALREDLGRAGDQTTDAVVPAAAIATARLVARQAGRVAGLTVACRAFTLLDPRVQVDFRAGDGEDVAAGATLAVISGPARPILTAERVALNLLGRLCGIATLTREVVAAVAGTGARVACTRKTTPGLRLLEKYAVRVGGGANHRFGLDDAVLIKDNHVAVAGGVAEAVRRARAAAGHLVKIEVEVTSLTQVSEALAAGAEVILLDNMSPEMLREAVALVDGRAVTEASGGITPENAAAVAATGVDVLSLGWLTHSAPALDVALDVAVPRGQDGGSS